MKKTSKTKFLPKYIVLSTLAVGFIFIISSIYGYFQYFNTIEKKIFGLLIILFGIMFLFLGFYFKKKFNVKF